MARSCESREQEHSKASLPPRNLSNCGLKTVAEVKVYYDKLGNTLTVWFGDPNEEYVCEETGDEVILMKNKSGVVIGFEKLNYSLQESSNLRFSFETLAA